MFPGLKNTSPVSKLSASFIDQIFADLFSKDQSKSSESQKEITDLQKQKISSNYLKHFKDDSKGSERIRGKNKEKLEGKSEDFNEGESSVDYESINDENDEFDCQSCEKCDESLDTTDERYLELVEDYRDSYLFDGRRQYIQVNKDIKGICNNRKGEEMYVNKRKECGKNYLNTHRSYIGTDLFYDRYKNNSSYTMFDNNIINFSIIFIV